MWHCSLSLPAGEDLSDERFEEVARAHLENMGMDPDKHQWCLVRHVDTPHSHVHLIASRISLDGKLWHGQHEALRAIDSCQELEKRFGLTLTPGLESGKEGARINRKDIAGAQARGVAAHRIPKVQIAAALDEALQRSTSLDQFKDEAERQGVEVRYVSNTGGIYGVSYRLTDENQEKWFKGSQVGKAYSLNSITRRLTGERDTPTSRRGPRVRQDILQKLAREQHAGKEIVRWSNGYLAAVATDSEIRWRTGSSAESSVCAALAKERGWQEMILADRGSDEKNRAAVEAYHSQGISVQLAGQRYPSPAAPVTKQKEIVSNGDDGRDPRTSPGGGGTAAPIPGAVEVDGGSSQRSPQEDQRYDSTTRPAAPVLSSAISAAEPVAEDDQRHRPAGQETTAQQEGEEKVDLLDFLNDPAGSRERAQRALEDLSEVNPGDHAARIIAKAHQQTEAVDLDPLDFLSEQGQQPELKPEPKTVTAQVQESVTHQPQPSPDPIPTNEDFQRAEDEAVAQLAKYEGDMEGARPRTSTQIEVDLVAVRHQREWHEMQSLIHRMKPGTMKEISSLREREGELGIALALALKLEAEARRQIRRDPAAMAAIHSRATGLARERTERKKADELRRMAEKAKQELVRQQKEEETERRRKAEENQRPAKKVKKGQKNAA
ncbi:MAG: hypothetical protein HKUEN07_03480 [Rhodocyclaceae bacterium]|nr:MAG: hypothetical protein HKUEN07_03480 [Rhodocyclaceae bacterium]